MSGFGVDRSSVASGSGASASSIPEAIIDAKGDLIAGSAADTPVRVPVGANETRVVADDTQAGGLKYVPDTTNYVAGAKGDLLVGTAADTVAALAVGAAGELLFPASGAATGLAWLRMPSAGAFLINGKISRSVAGNALTIAVKTLADADPSTGSPVYVLMPTVTSNVFDGGYVIRSITAALSMTVSSGSTLGHTSAVASPVYLYLLDNAGTLELAVSNKFFGGASVQTTTAEGGAGAADTGTVLYSTTLRSNVAVVCLQRWKSTQTTAGTWAATTGEVQLFPFPHKDRSSQVFTANGTYTKPWDILGAKTTVIAGGGGSGGTAATGAAQGSAAGGGGAGGTGIKTLSAASLGATETVTVGVGGAAASAGGVGGTGGTSSFGAHAEATGGVGGGAGTASGGTQPDGAGGAGGGASDGDWNFTGNAGGIGQVAAASGAASSGGFGAGSYFGGGAGAAKTATKQAGGVGAVYGGGASGASAGESQTAGVGSVGAAGIVVVEEFY